jgi:hypothetical protein
VFWHCNSSLPIYKATPVSAAVVAAADEASQSSHVGLIERDQSILDVMLTVGGGGEHEAEGQADSAQTTGKVDPNSPGWVDKEVCDYFQSCMNH